MRGRPTISSRENLKYDRERSGRILSSTVSTNAQIAIVCVLLCAAIGVIVTFLLSDSSTASISEYNSQESCQIESPSPQDVYACYVSRCTFDVSLCAENCPFGFTKDENNCESECTCAEKGIFEGDIYYDENKLPDLIERYGYSTVEQDFATFAGSASAYDYKLWKSDFVGGKYVIKYALKNDLTKEALESIQQGIPEFHRKTCIKFEEVPVGYNRMHILFIHAGFCSSPVGRSSDHAGDYADYTRVTIGINCGIKNVQHELLHALGFEHEQSRPDRDTYVEIIEDNIYENYKHNFEKARRSDVRDLNSPYDIKSIMHYNSIAFSKNRGTTIRSRFGGSVGGLKFTEEDLAELNALYKCPVRSSDAKMQWGEWTSWSQCHTTCGPGKKMRYRKCLSNSNEYANYCDGSSSEKMDCKIQSCPGEWGEWRPMGSCSKTCGRGYIWKTRDCNDVNGVCHGTPYITEDCNSGSCKKSAMWTSWSNWSQCRASCGKATATRVRFCQNSQGVKATSCDYRNADNQGQSKSCNLPSCQSLMKNWGTWSQCSATCEGYRRRKCFGGACTTGEEVDNCATRPCKEPDIFAKNRQTLNIDDVCNVAFTTENWLFGDFNGDGHVDIVCLDLYGIYQLSYGSRSGFNTVWSGPFQRCGKGLLIDGDVNGDGKSDLICKSKNERRLLIRYATDRSFHDTVVDGGTFCAKYSSSLTAITSGQKSTLLCHGRDHEVEMRIPST